MAKRYFATLSTKTVWIPKNLPSAHTCVASSVRLLPNLESYYFQMVETAPDEFKSDYWPSQLVLQK